jgi:hypothetical protein
MVGRSLWGGVGQPLVIKDVAYRQGFHWQLSGRKRLANHCEERRRASDVATWQSRPPAIASTPDSYKAQRAIPA